jgi:hypothetical protein
MVMLSAGCYRAKVNTGLPASTTVVTRWEHYFIVGLVSAKEYNATDLCQGRNAASVETQHTFVNGLVAALTFSLYTPITVTVVCSN